MDINALVDLILYSDVHETPLMVLGDHYCTKKALDFDDEQNTRLAIAATLKNMVDRGELKIN